MDENEGGEMDAGTDQAMVSALEVLQEKLGPETLIPSPKGRPESGKSGGSKGEPRTFKIKVTLRDVKPPVWRRLEVPSDITLPKLHEVLQTAMGWFDCHLHAFRVGDRVFAPPGDWDSIGEDSSRVTLDRLAPRKGSRLIYEYDFGDGWCHDILVEDVTAGRCGTIRCLKGRRRCPPEDCGGPWGYADLCEAIADPGHERHAELIEWTGNDFDPEEFDLEDIDAALRHVRL
jgi:hypothetical protein